MTGLKLTPRAFSRDAVRKALHHYAPHMTPYLLDNIYYCLDATEWKTVIKAIGPDPVSYASNRYDCDSFSRYWWSEVNHRFEVNGMMIVVDFAGQHSYNLLLTNDGGKIVPQLFEPQTLSSPDKGKAPYLLTRGFVL